MTVRIDKKHALTAADPSANRPDQGTEPAGKNIENRMINPVFFTIMKAVIQCQEVIGNGLSRTQFGNRDLKADRIVILKAHFPALSGKRNSPGEKRLVHGAASVCLARHIVMQTGLFLMVFGQFVDKGFVSSI